MRVRGSIFGGVDQESHFFLKYNRGVRRYKLVLIETPHNVRVNPAWGVAGLVGAVAGPVGAAAPVGPAVEAPWSVSKPSTWPKIDRSTPPPDSRQVRFRHRQPEALRTSETRQAPGYAREGPAATRACHQRRGLAMYATAHVVSFRDRAAATTGGRPEHAGSL